MTTVKKCVEGVFVCDLTFHLQNVDYEVRAGLSTVYADKGWVADDIHSESASRTLGYACEFLKKLPVACF